MRFQLSLGSTSTKAPSFWDHIIAPVHICQHTELLLPLQAAPEPVAPMGRWPCSSSPCPSLPGPFGQGLTPGGADALGQQGTGPWGLALAMNVVWVAQDSSEVQAQLLSHQTWKTPLIPNPALLCSLLLFSLDPMCSWELSCKSCWGCAAAVPAPWLGQWLCGSRFPTALH